MSQFDNQTLTPSEEVRIARALDYVLPVDVEKYCKLASDVRDDNERLIKADLKTDADKDAEAAKMAQAVLKAEAEIRGQRWPGGIRDTAATHTVKAVRSALDEYWGDFTTQIGTDLKTGQPRRTADTALEHDELERRLKATVKRP